MGSFRNPREFHGDVGFDGPADGRVAAMIAFRDVNEPLYGKDSRGISPNAAVRATRAPLNQAS
jgi:hypothetical protein